MQSHWRLDEYEWAKGPTLSEAAKNGISGRVL